jgi:hypothetical protein
VTCEVAVMNKRGVALAADSAVTLGEVEKIYHTAEKLFQLSARAPVGIMTYDSADMMGVPWETVIKLYKQKLGERTFEQLEQYGQDFLRFIEGSSNLFPESNQRDWFGSVVRWYWTTRFLQPLTERLQSQRNSTKQARAVLADLITEDHREHWKGTEAIDDLGPAYGDRVLSEYEATLDDLEKELFGEMKLTRELRDRLRTTVRLMYTQKGFHPEDQSGIVLAGFGESEPFPVLVHYLAGTIAAGKLRFFKFGEARITYADDAYVVPLAQRKVIDMFYSGIHPDLKEDLMNVVHDSLRDALKKNNKSFLHEVTAKLERDVELALAPEGPLGAKYTAPLTRAVSALPRHELAQLAETLVRLTAFRARMSTGESETVTEPIDVAVLSKGDGFVWVKHKNLVQRARETFE